MIEATFEIDDWNEDPVDDSSPKLTETIATKRFSGDIDGTSTIGYTMVYGENGTAVVVGIERVEATIGDRSGTLVLRHVGQFADGAATADITVMAEYGAGDFAGVTGSGAMRADPDGSMSLELD